jgi:hypothetical protein
MLRGRYSNSLVIDAGSHFTLRACSQAIKKLVADKGPSLKRSNFALCFQVVASLSTKACYSILYIYTAVKEIACITVILTHRVA